MSVLIMFFFVTHVLVTYVRSALNSLLDLSAIQANILLLLLLLWLCNYIEAIAITDQQYQL